MSNEAVGSTSGICQSWAISNTRFRKTPSSAESGRRHAGPVAVGRRRPICISQTTDELVFFRHSDHNTNAASPCAAANSEGFREQGGGGVLAHGHQSRFVVGASFGRGPAMKEWWWPRR